MTKEKEENTADTILLLQAVQDSTTVANLVVDSAYRIIAFNLRFREFLKKYWSHDLQAGEIATDFVHPDNQKAFREEFGLALSGRIIRAEHSFTTQAGATMWIAVEYHPVKHTSSEQKKVALSFRNVTRERVYEQKIMAQNKKLKDIAFVGAHQLRGSITSIMGLASLLSEENVATEDHQLYIQKITELSGKIDSQIRTLISKTEEI